MVLHVYTLGVYCSMFMLGPPGPMPTCQVYIGKLNFLRIVACISKKLGIEVSWCKAFHMCSCDVPRPHEIMGQALLLLKIVQIPSR